MPSTVNNPPKNLFMFIMFYFFKVDSDTTTFQNEKLTTIDPILYNRIS